MKPYNKLTEGAKKFIDTLQLSSYAISPLTSLAFAKAFADLALLPSAPIESEKNLGDLTNSSSTFAIKQFYVFTCEPRVRDIVFGINEIVVLDTKSILDSAAKFFLTRYNILYSSYFYPGVGPGIERVFGLDQYLTQDEIKILSENTEEFLRVYNQARSLINAISE